MANPAFPQITLPSLGSDLSAWLTACANAVAKLRAWAAANPDNPLAATASAAADDIAALAQSGSVVTIATNSVDEIKALVLAGKGIVHHQAVDTFGG